MSEASAQQMLALIPDDFKGQLLEMAVDTQTLAMILLSAHMIIFWLSQDSNVTPPVCLTAFAAAAIAKTPPMATGFMAWKIAKGLYIVPLLFAYTGFIGGSMTEVLTVFFFSLFGIYALVGFMEGYLEAPINIALRLLRLAAAIAMMWPHGLLLISIVGLIVFVAIFSYSRKIYNQNTATAESIVESS